MKFKLQYDLMIVVLGGRKCVILLHTWVINSLFFRLTDSHNRHYSHSVVTLPTLVPYLADFEI